MKKLFFFFLLIPFFSFAQKRTAGGGTGTGTPVYATSPTLVTPNLGTPSAINLSNGTALPTSGISGLGAGIATWWATPSSANLRAAVTDENGTGAALFNAATTPDFTTGFTIGAAAGNRKMMVGNGTNFVPSTETWPVPGATAGVTMIGDGTNWTATNTRENWTTFVVSGSAATTTGQTLIDITGLTSGTLTNSTKYEVEAWLDVSTSAVTTGTQYAIFANGTGGAAVYNAVLIGTTTTNAITQVTQSSATQQGTFLTTSGTAGIIYIHGFITTRGSGTATISIQHLKINSGTSTVAVGSKMKIRLAN